MAARRDRVTAPELEEFVVLEVHLTGVNLGTGAYGAVEEATIPGATIAAKKLHPELVNLGSHEQVRKWIRDFVEECMLMSRLRHPHVVQFIGICYFPESRLPVLLMEKLLTSLDSLLETTPNIPLDVKVYLLTGTGRGVVYLHGRAPPVIHRDLTARNILIDSGLTAKIADLGVARMVNIQPGQRAATMTQGPGNGLYMPPEAVPGEETTRYNTSIDIFSFGVVSLFTLTQTFPKNVKPASYFNHVSRKIAGRSEVERRQEYVDMMKTALGDDHSLVRLTLNCLEFLPEDRPSAEEVLTQLEEVRSTIPQQCTETKLELIQRIAGHHEEIQQVQREHQRQLTEQQAQIEQLQTTSGQQQAHIGNLQTRNNQLQSANGQLQRAQSQQQARIDSLQATCDRLKAEKQEQVDGLEELTTLQQQQLEAQRREIKRLSNQLRSLPLEGAVHQPHRAGQVEVLLSKPRKTVQAMRAEITPSKSHPQDKSSPQPSIPSSITFNWRRFKDTPHNVFGQPVALNGRLFIRGDSSKGWETVRTYIPSQDRWLDELPEPPVKQFTIGTHNGQLLVVGGRDKTTGKTTNTILIFDEHSRQWVQSYPVMPTAVITPTVIGYQDHLIVAGGWHPLDKRVTIVNILNTSTNKWITAKRLPTTDDYYTALIEDTLYLVGQDTKCVLCAHVPTLISGATRKSGVWESLPNSTFYDSTPIAVHNTLLTVGGSDRIGLFGGNPTSSIYMYDRTKNQWTRVSDLPEPMSYGHCTVLSGELFVLGAFFKSSVYVAKLSVV